MFNRTLVLALVLTGVMAATLSAQPAVVDDAEPARMAAAWDAFEQLPDDVAAARTAAAWDAFEQWPPAFQQIVWGIFNSSASEIDLIANLRLVLLPDDLRIALVRSKTSVMATRRNWKLTHPVCGASRVESDLSGDVLFGGCSFEELFPLLSSAPAVPVTPAADDTRRLQEQSLRLQERSLDLQQQHLTEQQNAHAARQRQEMRLLFMEGIRPRLDYQIPSWVIQPPRQRRPVRCQSQPDYLGGMTTTCEPSW